MADEKYPNNSYAVRTSYNKPEADKTSEPQEKKEEQTIEGSVKLRKKSLGQKFLDSIFAEDILSLKESLWNNVLIPKIQDFLCDSVNTMFHKGRSSGSSTGGTVYNSISRPATAASSSNQRIYSLSGGSIQSTLDDIMMYSLDDVKRLYVYMRDYISLNGFITVGTVYRYLKMPSDQSKENFGWFSITPGTFTYVKSYDENGVEVYCPKLPKPVWVRE